MTVITKPLNDKKNEKLETPLVKNIHIEFPEDKEDEIGGNSKLPASGKSKMVVIGHLKRRSSATTICLFVTAFLALSCAINSGIYLYKQFVLSQEHQVKGWCKIPYEESIDDISSLPQNLDMPTNDYLQNIENERKLRNFFEGFEINLPDQFERITVPEFSGSRSSEFVHDFINNKTGIVDRKLRECYVMPLNRTVVMPPRNLSDVFSMLKSGSFSIDMSVVIQMRVVHPALTDTSSVGSLIQKVCSNFPIYRLEKFEPSVFKRSIAPEKERYSVFSGKITHVEIYNPLNKQALNENEQ